MCIYRYIAHSDCTVVKLQSFVLVYARRIISNVTCKTDVKLMYIGQQFLSQSFQIVMFTKTA